MSAPRLVDMHCHLDFFADPAQVAREAAGLDLAMLAVTVTPQGFIVAQETLRKQDNIRLAVGLHPWWVADGRCNSDDVRAAAELAGQERFVGEIGVDLSPAHVPEGSQDAQARAFEAVCRSCAAGSGGQGRKVLSIHSVRAAGLVLDVLENTCCLQGCSCVFHWFTGTSDELHRALQAGCFFSVNEMMLRTRRGREYARQLPANRLLLETDLPPENASGYTAEDVAASLESTLATLRELRGQDVQEITTENARALLDL